MPNVVDRLGGASSSLAFKAPCRLATTANITLSGYQTIDGTLPTSSEHVDLRRILVKDQTATATNGIYIMDTGAWVRAKDFDSVNDIRQGTRIYVFGGSTQSGTYLVTSAVDPSTFTLDTTGITIAEVGTFDQTTSALGMASGGVISWDSGDVTITHSSSALAFAGAGAGYSFDNGVTLSSAFTVSGAVTLSSAVTINALTVSSAATVSGAFTASSAATFSGTVIASTNVLVGSTAAVPFDAATNAKVQSNATDATNGFSAARFSADTSPARLTLLKSRNATIGSHTVVQSGDTIGEIRASGSDGTIFSQAALILFQVDGTPGSSDMPGRVVVQTSSDGSATPSEKFRADSTGVVLTGPVQAVSGTTITQGGVAGRGILLFGSTTFGIYAGSSAPAIAAGIGSLYLRDDGASSLTRAYINNAGTTTWVALLTTA